MKKFISVLLALIISISIIPFSERSAFAQDEELVDIDIFKAQCMAGIAEDSHSNAVAQCNSLYNYYVNDNIYSPTQTFLDTMYANENLMATYETWQIYNLEKTPSAALQQIANKEDYYESLIIGMYQKALVQQSDMKELLNNKILNDSRDMVSSLCEITSASDAAELSGMMALSDSETYAKVTETVENKYPSGIASKVVGNISLIFEAAENVVDALDRISVYASMAELDESAKLWLQQLYDSCGTDFPVELKNAVSNLKDASMGFADAALVSVKENTFSLSLWAFDSVINAGIQSAAALNPITNAVMIGLTAGKTICNIFFGSDDIYEQLYLMECIYEIQDLSRRVAENCKNTFVNKQTKENALAFNYAVDCYYESIINIDIDCMKSFLDKLYNGGIDLGSAGGVLDLVISWVYGTPDDYDDAVDSLESLRNTRITNKQNLEAYVWIALMANHPETYNYYFPDKDMVPVTSLSLLVTYILPEGYEHETNKTKIVEGDDATYWVDYSPEEADLTDYTITVSDPEILQVKDGVILALKPGTATVTATSTADDHVFDTEEIEVIERIEESEDDDDESASSKFTYTISNNEVTITGLADGYEPTELVIPSTIEGYPVTKLETSAELLFVTSVTSITIPESIVNITGSLGGPFAFWTNLLSINVSKDNQYYSSNDGVLYNKDKTKLIRFPVKNARTEYNIPDTVTSIGEGAFIACYNLIKVKIPASVTSIGNYAFSGCCLKELTLPESITSIGICAFFGTQLENIIVSDNNQYYSSQDGVLFNKDKTKLIQYPIGSKRTEYNIPDCVTSIGEGAFMGLGAINLINFRLTIPLSVTSIGNVAFSLTDCSIDIYYCGSENQWNNIEKSSDIFSANDNVTIHFSEELPQIIEDSKTGITISEETLGVFPNNTILVIDELSSASDSITYEITLQKDGEEIQPNGTVTVKIPVPKEIDGTACKVYRQESDNTYTDMNAVYQDGYMVFTTDHFSRYVLTESDPNDTGATANEFEYTVLNDGTVAITKYNGNDTVLNIPYEINGHLVTSINGFDSNYNLEEVWIPNSVTSLGSAAFYGCENLKSVVIGNGITEIPESAFKNCFSLEKIVISDSVNSIPRMTFWDAKIDAIIYGYKDSEAENYQQIEMHTASNFYVLPDVTDDGKLDLYYSLEETMVNEVLYSLYLNLNVASIAVKDSQGNSVTNTEQSILPGMMFDVTLDDGSKLVFSIPNVATGDVTGDGIVDAADAVMIQRYDAGLINLTTQQLQAADVTGDGMVDAADAVRIQRYDAGLISSL